MDTEVQLSVWIQPSVLSSWFNRQVPDLSGLAGCGVLCIHLVHALRERVVRSNASEWCNQRHPLSHPSVYVCGVCSSCLGRAVFLIPQGIVNPPHSHSTQRMVVWRDKNVVIRVSMLILCLQRPWVHRSTCPTSSASLSSGHRPPSSCLTTVPILWSAAAPTAVLLALPTSMLMLIPPPTHHHALAHTYARN